MAKQGPKICPDVHENLIQPSDFSFSGRLEGSLNTPSSRVTRIMHGVVLGVSLVLTACSFDISALKEPVPAADGAVPDASGDAGGDVISGKDRLSGDTSQDSDAETAGDAQTDSQADSGTDGGTDAPPQDGGVDGPPPDATGQQDATQNDAEPQQDGGVAPGTVQFSSTMPCYKVLLVSNTNSIIPSGSSPNDNACQVNPFGSSPLPGYSLFVWVRNPTQNNAIFTTTSSPYSYTAKCSNYTTPPNQLQMGNEYLSTGYSPISNSSTLPNVTLSDNCTSSASYIIKY